MNKSIRYGDTVLVIDKDHTLDMYYTFAQFLKKSNVTLQTKRYKLGDTPINNQKYEVIFDPVFHPKYGDKIIIIKHPKKKQFYMIGKEGVKLTK